jgi:hypothetical protein
MTSDCSLKCLFVDYNLINPTLETCREAIDFLVNEGYIYSTIDDDHHKSTNG